MPCVRMDTGLWAKGLEVELLETVQPALVSAFKVPESDRDVILDLYDEKRRLFSTGRTERYTRIEIIGIAARSAGAKRELFQSIADNLEALRVAIRCVSHECPLRRRQPSMQSLAKRVF